MTIKEIEERCGLTRSNIRFYEKEGLIKPERSANGYRNYSDTDLLELQKITALRGLGFSVEEIRAIQQDQPNMHLLLLHRQKELSMALTQVQDAVRICNAMLSDSDLHYDNFEPSHYITDFSSHVHSNGKYFIPDTVAFIRFFSGEIIWMVITALCFLLAFIFYRYLPDQIPVQWNAGYVTNTMNRWFIFAYGGFCLLARPFLWPVLWSRFPITHPLKEVVVNYLISLLCFILLSVQIFTILYLYHILEQVTLVLVLDLFIFALPLLFYMFSPRQ